VRPGDVHAMALSAWALVHGLAMLALDGQIHGKLNGAVNKALAKPELAANFLKEGAIATPLSPAQFGKVIADDVERWKKLAKQQNITAD